MDAYVAKSGDEMLGTLTMRSSTFLRIENNKKSWLAALKKEGEGTTLFEVSPGNGFKIVATVSGKRHQVFKVYDDGSLILVGLKEPDPLGAKDAAVPRGWIENYVADEIKKIPAPSADVDKKYVDEQCGKVCRTTSKKGYFHEASGKLYYTPM